MKSIFTVTIAPLSTPDATTATVRGKLVSAPKLFLQTAQHPFVRTAIPAGMTYTAMDDLYELAEDFDALNAMIADRLARAGECVYAVTGNIRDTQLPVIRARVEACGGRVRILPGVPLCIAAFPDCPAGVSFPAASLPAVVDPSLPICVEEIDTRIKAGSAKLLLSEYFPDDWPILVAHVDERGGYTRAELPLYELDRQDAYCADTVAYLPPVPFESRERFGYADVEAVIARLRAPDGCPWDREQTHASLKPALIEESYELLDAIDEGDDAHMVEELGDVLMQVALHDEIAAEQCRFTSRDVTTRLVQKLIYRHPHVFGDVTAETSAEVLRNWDALKMREKEQRTQTEALKSVPRSLPALTRSRKVQKRAASVGFDWHSAEEAFPKIAEETDELRRAMGGDGSVDEELGDLLFAVVNVARLLKLEPELLLMRATDKFIDRFEGVEQLAAERGKTMEACSFDELDAFWDEVKHS